MKVMDDVIRSSQFSSCLQLLPSTRMTDEIFQGSSTAKHGSCAVCIIRPHAVREGRTGAIVEALLSSGFDITAAQSFSLTVPQAETFYEVYKTVLPSAQYSAMITELASGV